MAGSGTATVVLICTRLLKAVLDAIVLARRLSAATTAIRPIKNVGKNLKMYSFFNATPLPKFSSRCPHCSSFGTSGQQPRLWMICRVFVEDLWKVSGSLRQNMRSDAA